MPYTQSWGDRLPNNSLPNYFETMPIKTTHDLMKSSFRWLGSGAEYLIKSTNLNKKEGASFGRGKDIGQYLNSRNKGLLLDGYTRRLSEDMSFQNVAVYGVTGTGKSSTFVVPNILDKAKQKAVLIVNDMKGDLYRTTSGYMERNGYRVIVLNPHDLANSHRFNPFLDLQHENETIHLAQMFVQVVASAGKDQIWTSGAERFVTFFLKCLRKGDPRYNNPHNLYYLFQNFGSDGSNLHKWVAEHVYDDPFLINEWKSLLSVHQDGVLSFIMNAVTALKIFANREVCQLTATSDIDLSTLRHEKTIIYVVTPPQYQKMYMPVTSMFFLSFLQASMREIPGRGDLPVYFLYDEFGNSFLPDFDIFATTVRQYKISLMLFMQGMNQLVKRYGREQASVILSGIVTQISFGAAEQETAEYFSRRAGKVRVIQRPNLKDPQLENYSERNLINASEIRELPDRKILLIAHNRKTALIDTVPAYENSRYRRLLNIPPAPIYTNGSRAIEFVEL